MELLRAGPGDGASSCLGGKLSLSQAARRGLCRPPHPFQWQPCNEYARCRTAPSSGPLPSRAVAGPAAAPGLQAPGP